MSEARLGRDVFLALAAVGWADGKLDGEEADAIVRAAAEEGLSIEEIAAVEEATKSPLDLSAINLAGMSKADRLFVYAVGSWMTRLDGHEAEEEAAMLARLGDELRIPARPREHADAIAREIAAASDASATRFDLPKLRATIEARLAEAQRQRAAAGEQD